MHALSVLYRDDDLVAVFKPPGLLVHRSALDAHETDTALDRLRSQWRADTGEGVPTGLAPAHRLDKGTSGLLLFACHADAARRLGQAFDAGQVRKRYLALVRGWPPAEGRVDHPLARDPEQPSTGQPQLSACSEFTRLACVEWAFAVDARHASSRYALTEWRPLTGRRHQIRRHAKYIGHPLIGDATHGKGPHNRAVAAWLGIARLWLHAQALSLPHPRDGRVLRLQAAPGPEWQLLRGHGAWQDDPPPESGR
jgi:tRNA pseudouridine65 synthase